MFKSAIWQLLSKSWYVQIPITFFMPQYARSGLP